MSEKQRLSDDEIFERVQGVLDDALGVDKDEVTPQAKLMAELGAESIDSLDIVWRLEKTFRIKIPNSEFLKTNDDGHKEFAFGVDNIKLVDLTVQHLVDHVRQKLNPVVNK
jgi:acyl carrier protein